MGEELVQRRRRCWRAGGQERVPLDDGWDVPEDAGRHGYGWDGRWRRDVLVQELVLSHVYLILLIFLLTSHLILQEHVLRHGRWHGR